MKVVKYKIIDQHGQARIKKTKVSLLMIAKKKQIRKKE
jgi:hypothetical protein